MTSEALDLKYRPRKFRDVIGNQGVVKLLLRRSSFGTLSGRSMMFGGPKGCGKTSLARITAMAVTCDNLNDGEPCGVCTSCESVIFDSSMSVDEFDAATQGTVDRIRSIISDLDYGSADGKPKVVILDEAQRLSKAAQDALLKSIEDRRFVVILCTTEPYKIGGAIRSRLEEYPISPPSENDIISRLELVCKSENIKYEPEALEIVAKHNKCCPRTCLTSLDTIRTLGEVSVSVVKGLFRYNSMETLVGVLSRVDSDPASAFDDLDHLFSYEGASWVCDNIVAAISSSLRIAIGAKATYPVSSDFFQARGLQWGNLARALGSIDKPTPHDIESAIISTGRANVTLTPEVLVRHVPSSSSAPAPAPAPAPAHQTIIHSVPVPIVQTINPAAAPAPAPKLIQDKAFEPVPSKSMTIDGVNFTCDEQLTSLDHKVGNGSVAPLPPAPLTADMDFDRSKIPIPEKEFSRGLVQRFKKPI